MEKRRKKRKRGKSCSLWSKTTFRIWPLVKNPLSKIHNKGKELYILAFLVTFQKWWCVQKCYLQLNREIKGWRRRGVKFWETVGLMFIASVCDWTLITYVWLSVVWQGRSQCDAWTWFIFIPPDSCQRGSRGHISPPAAVCDTPSCPPRPGVSTDQTSFIKSLSPRYWGQGPHLNHSLYTRK